MDIINAFILGIIEGFTEFLPVSSTAHLILASKILNIADTEYVKSFEIIIQLGAILSVVFLYWKSFLQWEVIKRLVIAFIPTGIIGILLYKLIKTYLMGNVSVVLAALMLGGVIIIVFEKMFHSKNDASDVITDIPYKDCFTIGLFQALAVVPGVSRSASTIIGGLLLGLNRKAIVEFSFLLAIPTMLAATLLDLYKTAGSFSIDQIGFLTVGFITSFFTALFSIKFLLAYIRKKSFTVFGVYRVAIALLFFLVFFLKPT